MKQPPQIIKPHGEEIGQEKLKTQIQSAITDIEENIDRTDFNADKENMAPTQQQIQQQQMLEQRRLQEEQQQHMMQQQQLQQQQLQQQQLQQQQLQQQQLQQQQMEFEQLRLQEEEQLMMQQQAMVCFLNNKIEMININLINERI